MGALFTTVSSISVSRVRVTLTVTVRVSMVSVMVVSRHFGPRTLRTQDISALSDWCRTVSTSITHAKMPTLGLMLSLH